MTINGINGTNAQMGQMGMNSAIDSYSNNTAVSGTVGVDIKV